MAHSTIVFRAGILAAALFPLNCIISSEGFPDTPECVGIRKQLKENFRFWTALYAVCARDTNAGACDMYALSAALSLHDETGCSEEPAIRF